jgi:hypothetical protein
MDEVLIANLMIFQYAVEQGNYDLVIAGTTSATIRLSL